MKYDAHFTMLPVMAFRPIGRRMTLEGGGKSSAAPDYTGAAGVQAASSKEATTAQNWANRPTINTPWGSQTWDASQTVDPATGQPVTSWAQNINLSPEQAAALKGQQGITQGRTDLAGNMMGQVANATAAPMDWSKLPGVPGSLQDAQKGAFATMSAALQPGRDWQQKQLDTKLANMGLPINSAAYNQASNQLAGQWGQEDKTLLAQAMGQGASDVNTQLGMRQAAIAEEAQRRGMPLNELNALLTGQQVSMPAGMSGAPNATSGAAQGNQALTAALGQGNFATANQPNWGAGVGGIASLLASL
jgi:hypothetical protein